MQPNDDGPELKTVKTKKGIEDVRLDVLKLARRIQALPHNRLHVVVTFRLAGILFACVLSGDGVKLERFD